jgi:hypothetical protein
VKASDQGLGKPLRCLWCGAPLKQRAGRGRPRSYCADGCAAAAHAEQERQRRARKAGRA